jgi:hypothetical protein
MLYGIHFLITIPAAGDFVPVYVTLSRFMVLNAQRRLAFDAFLAGCLCEIKPIGKSLSNGGHHAGPGFCHRQRRFAFPISFP